MHISLYRAALVKVNESPLTLNDTDFQALEQFGGPADVARGQAAIRQAVARSAAKHTSGRPDDTRLVTKAASVKQALREPVARQVSGDGGSAIAGQSVAPSSWVLDFAVSNRTQEYRIEKALSDRRVAIRENARTLAADMLADGVPEDLVANTVTALLGWYTDEQVATLRKDLTTRVLAGE